MIKKLLFFVSLFVFLSPHVLADTIDSYYIQDTSSTKSTYWNAYDTWSYENQYIVFNGQSERYVILSTCLTGTLDMEVSSNIQGTLSYLDYYTGESCSVQGYNGSMYYYVFYVNNFYNPQSQGQYYNSFNLYVSNTESFRVVQDIFSVNSSISNPLENININQSIEDLNDNVNQQFEDLNNNVNQQFEDLNDNFQTCPQPVDLSYSVGKKFNATGVLVDDANYSYTEDYYSLDSSHKITFKNVGTSNVGYVILYDSSKNQVGYFGIRDRTISSSSAVYYRLSTNNLNLQVYLGTGECTNKIDKTNESLNDLNNNITNDNVSGVEESFSQFEDFLDDNSTITQLITLPVTLYSSILQGISNSCTPFNLGNLYGESLILPCINIGNYLGSTLWGMIDLIISGFAIYSISKKLIKVFNNFSSMKDGDVIDD